MKKLTLIPKILKDFQCTGSRCENHCCYGWDIYIDRTTYIKYDKLSNKQLRLLLNKRVTVNPKSNGDWNYAKIELNEEKKCPLLTEEGLCRVHKELGPVYLCHTCNTYPRIYNSVANTLESSLYISCPEAARRILLHPEKMQFDEIELLNENILIPRKKITQNQEKIFWNLRIFTITLLQERKFRVWQRLIILGVFYEKTSQLFKENDVEGILKLIESYQYLIQYENLDYLFEQLQVNEGFQLDMMKLLSDARSKLDITDRVFNQCIDQFNKGLQFEKEDAVKTQELYQDTYKKYFNPYMDKHEHILENYLVYSVYTELFPFGTGKELFDEYALLVLQFSMIKMYLVGMTAYNQKINDVMITDIIHSFSRVFSHGNPLLVILYDLLKQKNRMSMEHISLLLKN